MQQILTLSNPAPLYLWCQSVSNLRGWSSIAADRECKIILKFIQLPAISLLHNSFAILASEICKFHQNIKLGRGTVSNQGYKRLLKLIAIYIGWCSAWKYGTPNGLTFHLDWAAQNFVPPITPRPTVKCRIVAGTNCAARVTNSPFSIFYICLKGMKKI